MSGNSVLQKSLDIFGLGSNLAQPKQANLQSPNALSETPSKEQAQEDASKKTLAKEQMAASTSTVLTGGTGLLDEPTTTSRVLVGA